eukprot:COSAG06_NODE_508_length_14925_cov_18.648995_6_plen_144_part_00
MPLIANGKRRRRRLSLPRQAKDRPKKTADETVGWESCCTPYMMMIYSGAMLSIEEIVPDVAAILECRYPGQQGGDAIFNTIYGMNAPAGTPLSCLVLSCLVLSCLGLPWLAFFALVLIIALMALMCYDCVRLSMSMCMCAFER